MKKNLFALALLIALVSGCKSGNTQDQAQNTTEAAAATGAQSLTADELKAQMQQQPGEIIDVRTPDEFIGEHLQGAVNLDYSGGTFAQQIPQLDKSKTYYLYCKSGNRSGKAAQLLKEAGFENVYNVGGIGALKEAGVPVAEN